MKETPNKNNSELDTFLTAAFAHSVNIFDPENYFLVFKYNIRFF